MKYIRDDALDGSGSCTTFSMADKAYYVIKRRILEVALAPGVRVSELQIAQELGIGKTPVREALGRLVQEGLIKNLPYTGYDVTPVTLRDVQELFGLRLIVEPEAVALAAGRVDVDLLCEIEQACQRAYSHETPSQVSEFLQLNHRFHMTIAEASGNRRLVRVVDSVLTESERLHHIGIRFGKVMRHRHDKVLAALQNRDAVLARQITVEQIQSNREAMVNLVLSTPSLMSAPIDSIPAVGM